MNNELYKMMIVNARTHLSKYPDNPNDIDAFRISEVLSICLAKSKESIIEDIINS